MIADSSDDGVSLQAQYQAAWAEVNARIVSRQNAFNSFVITIGGIVALLTRDFGIAFGLSWLPAFVTIVFTPWIVQNSLVIELLCRFCDACVAYNQEPTREGTLEVPRWHSKPQQWFEQASKTRSSLDWSLVGIAALCFAYSVTINGLALYEALFTTTLSTSLRVGWQVLCAVLSLLVAFVFSSLAIWMVWNHSEKRKDMRAGNWQYTLAGQPPTSQFLRVAQSPNNAVNRSGESGGN